ncbi:transcriptional adapter 3-like [Sipha flava]|uniref:Transcriptional adapter 3-like n=1 Tax=Sipha flava TaxID=143950 RepID=A0A8B8GHC7_9HEMI|nr:transcriptional adapter 3-like [Sipha flava]
MAPKRKTRSKIMTKKRVPKSHISQPSDIETPSPSTIRQNNPAIEEITLTRLKSLNIKKNPTYISLKNLVKSREDNSQYMLTDDELDQTQWFLESMLSSIMFRKISIQNELASLKSIQSTSSQGPSTNNPCPSAIRPKPVAKIPLLNEYIQNKSIKKSRKTKEKSEPENKFWSTVKPYLAHVDKKNLLWLEKMVLSYELSDDIFKVPALGEHYSKNWTQKDLKNQKNQPSCSQTVTKNKLSTPVMPNVVELVNKINLIAQNNDDFRPIYQRVTSALLEHSSLTFKDFEEKLVDGKNNEDELDQMSNSCKKFNEEQNVEKQFQELGLKDCHSKLVPPTIKSPPSYTKSDEDDDEILDEINKCNIALAELQNINKNHLTSLLNRCREDYFQQKTYKKMKKVENEILNYKRQPNKLLSNDEKIAQYSKENYEMKLLTDKRNKYLTQLHLKKVDPDKYLSNFFSDESELSDEETNQFQEHFEVPTFKNVMDIHHTLETDEESEYKTE